MIDPDKIIVKERKFGPREKTFDGLQTIGIVYPDKNLIKIDPRLTPEEWASVLLHELLHKNFPFLSEDAVIESEWMMKVMIREFKKKQWWVSND